MHWTYAEVDSSQLCQGDVLGRTAEVEALLKEVHPWFHSRRDNVFFMVLTQTCDLVRRPAVKAEHIAICPVRPLEHILVRALKGYVAQTDANIPVGTEKDKQKFKDFLGRLFNNNEPGLFYLDDDGGLLGQDCCAIPRLSISIKASLHYDKCLAAKRVQLSEPFRAKLGWAVGNIYSRVGTRDWEPERLNKKVDAALDESIVWVPTDPDLRELVKSINEASAHGPIDDAKVRDLRRAIPNRKQQLLDLVSTLMTDARIDEAQRKQVLKFLGSDPQLKQLVRG